MSPLETPACLYDYELLSEIGAEGPAIIYRARQKSLDRPVTLHLVQLAEFGDAAEGERYMRAARAAARLDHPSIVRVFDLGSDDGFAFVATGLVEGEMLTQRFSGKPLPPKQAAELMYRLATAVASAHQRGVLHRGLDPQQVRLDAAGQPRIVGFGTLRSFISGASLTSSSAAVSPYTPPESVEGSSANHPSIDIYGLGGLMYFVLTGKPPFVAASVPDLVSAIAAKTPSLPSRQKSRIPKELDAICLKCLAKKPADRYADAADVAEALRRWLKPDSQSTMADPLAETIVPHDASTRNLGKSTHRPRRQGRVIGISLTAILLLGIGAWGLLRRPPADEPEHGAASLAASEPRPVPAAAVAPFDETAARQLQKDWARYLGTDVETTNSIGMKLRIIPPGEFDMGATDEEIAERVLSFAETSKNRDQGFRDFALASFHGESPRHHVRITRPFYLGTYEVTIADFEQFVHATGYRTYNEQVGAVTHAADPATGRWTFSAIGPEFNWKTTGVPQDPHRPVGLVAWHDVEAFCDWLTGREGAVYRVPTEAEWEYACRAGSTTLMYRDLDRLREHINGPDQSSHKSIDQGAYAWLPWDDGFPFAAPVGHFKPNPFGLFDMIGNQWEVCSDWFRTDAYQHSAPEDPQGPPSGDIKVARGGGFEPTCVPEAMTETCRISKGIVPGLLHHGFRVLREVDPPAEGTLDSLRSSRGVAGARNAINHAAVVPLHGDFNIVRAVDCWKAAGVHVQRAERTVVSPDDRRTVESLRAIVDSGITFSQGIRGVERRLFESMSEDSWRGDDNAAAQSLQQVFLASGWDVRSMSPTEARAKLDVLPLELQTSVKHWLTRWEIYAAAAKRSELATLQAIASSLDDSSWYQLFLAARTEANPGQLLKLAASVPPTLRMTDRTLVLESLAARDLIGKPEAQVFIDSSRAVAGTDVEKFWFHWRAAQSAQLRAGSASSTGESVATIVTALEAAVRVSPDASNVQARLAIAEALSPFTMERQTADWVFEQGGTVQIIEAVRPAQRKSKRHILKREDLPKQPFTVTGVSFNGAMVGDVDLPRLGQLPELTELYFDGTAVTDDGLRRLLVETPRLLHLGLAGTAVTGAIAKDLSGLKSVNLGQTGFTASAVEQLLDLRPGIRVLHESLPSVPPPPEGVFDLGFGLRFEGRGGLEIPLDLDLSKPFTFEVVVSVPAALRGGEIEILCSKESDSAALEGSGFRLTLGDDNLITTQYAFPTPGQVQAALPVSQRLLPPERPVCLAIVFDGKTLFTFRDGILLEWQGIQSALPGNKRRLLLGQSARQPTEGLRGVIDEVRISSVSRYDRDFNVQLPLAADDKTEALYHFDGMDAERLQDVSGHNRQPLLVGHMESQPQLAYGAELPPVTRPQVPDGPPHAVAPFDAEQARLHQEAWARHLGVPIEFTNSLGMKFRLIPPGEFLMGTSLEQLEAICNLEGLPEEARKELRKEEVPLHRVVITRPIWFGMTEVTYPQFKQFIDSTGYTTAAERFPGWQGATWRRWPGGQYKFTDSTPVFGIAWQDGAEFCNWLSRREEKDLSYRRGGSWSWIRRTDLGYRLPTEAEWEYACRAGTTTPFSFGEATSLIDQYAWTNRNSGAVPRPIATKNPNSFGLFDMHGNLAEWCQDCYREGYRHHAEVEDPIGPWNGSRIARSGSIADAFVGTRSTMRWALFFQTAPTNRFAGFRVVLNAVPAVPRP